MAERRISMRDVEVAVNDIDICGGEISYRVSDLAAFLEGRNLTHPQRNRLIAASRAAMQLVDRLGSIRKQLGLHERPKE